MQLEEGEKTKKIQYEEEMQQRKEKLYARALVLWTSNSKKLLIIWQNN